MAYVALKPCCFAGQRFKIGGNIPDGIVHPGNAKNLVKMGVIAEQNGAAETTVVKTEIIQQETINVVIHAKEGDMPLNLTAEGLQNVVDVLTGKASEVEPIIAQMTDGDALILLHITDSRKAVKEAAEARAQALSPEEPEDEQSPDPEESEGDQ